MKTELVYKDICVEFMKQAEIESSKTALVCEGLELTYEILNQKSNQLANFLLSKGIRENDIVGVIAGRGINLIISLLGILKVGATYLPIDINNPQKRITYIIEDSGATLVLLAEDYIGDLAVESYLVKSILDGDFSVIFAYPNYEKNRNIYYIYTSGSTGYPKGVIIKYEDFMNLLNWYISEFKINQTDKNYLISSISFDLAQKNLFCMFIVGGELHLYPSCKLDYTDVIRYIKKNQITIINCTPSVFKPVIDFCFAQSYEYLSTLRYLFLGGESVDLNIFKSWLSTKHFNCSLINQYGPTECTDVTLYYVIDTEKMLETIPIGKPIYNVQAYILDEDMNLSDNGELYLGGACVGQYIKQESFDSPFLTLPNISDSKLYRTGDLVKSLDTGDICFCGRKDDQIKRKGHRIELLEIERQLGKIEILKEIAVVFDSYEDKITAFFISDQEIDYQTIKLLVSDMLPEWMIPNELIQIEKMPLTVSGKIDRQKLLKYGFKAEEINTNDSKQEIFLKCCKNVLRKSDITLDSVFLCEGGDSLDVVSIICMLYEYGFAIEPYFLFTNKPLKDLLQNLHKTETKELISEYAQSVAISYYQRKYVDYYFKNDFLDFGNSVTQVKIKSLINIDTFKLVLSIYMQNMNVLRMSLANKEYFEIVEEAPIKFEYKTVGKANEKLMAVYAEKLLKYHFDLKKPPFFHVLLLECDYSNETVLFFVTNSIFFDKISIDLLINDIVRMYFLEYTPNYMLRDELIYNQSSLMEKEYSASFNFWRCILQDVVIYLKNSGSSNKIGDGESVSFVLDTIIYKKIKDFCRQRYITSNMFFLAVYAHFIKHCSAEKQIIIGETVSTRKGYNEYNAIGSFVNQIILNIDVDSLEKIDTLFLTILKQKQQWKKHNRFPIEFFVYEEKLSIPYRYGYHYWEREQNDPIINKQCLDIFYYDASPKNIIRDLSFTVREHKDSFQLLFRVKKEIGLNLDIYNIQKSFEHILMSFI